jgi:hypothetical protein
MAIMMKESRGNAVHDFGELQTHIVHDTIINHGITADAIITVLGVMGSKILGLSMNISNLGNKGTMIFAYSR